jgi:hypothetical protein
MLLPCPLGYFRAAPETRATGECQLQKALDRIRYCGKYHECGDFERDRPTSHMSMGVRDSHLALSLLRRWAVAIRNSQVALGRMDIFSRGKNMKLVVGKIGQPYFEEDAFNAAREIFETSDGYTHLQTEGGTN